MHDNRYGAVGSDLDPPIESNFGTIQSEWQSAVKTLTWR
jgi:hypothetical protein